ncbi:T9SS type A sorting domain-containing protein [Flavobacterium sp. NG2]|uniref:T9SS type A sorting domain-containing protein n=1 Tax=Flavobacterium sp. NG2 TaxID=3097547 RepID=UPI002A81ACE4|nr:T9SS type A sorting domain-containing protein [Flavobacterium sp. NG2]WPR72666.1 T9SS type A sorting domain-containing protein [Flavobacterium sp. NG2]
MKKLYTIIFLIVFTILGRAQNKLLSSINEYYTGSSWEKSWGYNYEYDSNNNLISETNLNWVFDHWEIHDKTTYTYDVNNKVILELGQDWNSTTGMLENSYRDTYTYVNGKFSGQVSEYWESSNWVNEWKVEVSYGGNNLPSGYLSYEWDGSQWVVESQGTFSYDGNNRVSTETSQDWVNSTWINSYKTLYTYNANNKILNNRGAEWDDFNNLWSENERTDYELDLAGNRIVEVNVSEYNNITYKNKVEYAYDESSLMNNFAHPYKDKNGVDYLTEDFPYVNKLLTATNYSFNSFSNTYSINNRTTYNYNNSIVLSTENPELLDLDLKVFPNPASSVLNLDFPALETIDKVIITDVMGRVVLQQQTNLNQIKVDELAAGLYILEVYSGNKKNQTKFIKD